MHAHGFDFSKPAAIEFFALLPSEDAAGAVARQYVADHVKDDSITKIVTRRTDDGEHELEIVKFMHATHENITEFEQVLANRVEAVGGCLDGWGVMHG